MKGGIQLSTVRKQFLELGIAVCTDAVDDEGVTWPYAIRRSGANCRVFYSNFSLLLGVLRAEKKIAKGRP